MRRGEPVRRAASPRPRRSGRGGGDAGRLLDARLDGETEHRLYAVPVWREAPFFTPRERAFVCMSTQNAQPFEA